MNKRMAVLLDFVACDGQTLRPMPRIQVDLGAVVAYVDTVEEAAQLARAYQAGPGTPGARSPLLTPTRKRAVKFLRVIRSAGATGVTPAEAAKLMNLPGARSIPGLIHALQNVLRDAGYDPDAVVIRKRVGPDGSAWFPGPALEAALVRLGIVDSDEPGRRLESQSGSPMVAA